MAVPIPFPILERLRCTLCKEPLALSDLGNLLTCPYGHPTRIDHGVIIPPAPEGSDPVSARTFETFGFEWNTFDKIRHEDEAFWRNYFADVPLAELNGKIGLDAGCGKGRFTVFTAPYLAALVAMDGSSAARVAARNLAEHKNVVVVQSDLRNAPFARESLDFICCLGVLHHLSDPEGAFSRLLELLVPGGLMLIYLYSRPESRSLRGFALAVASSVRRLTVRLPLGLLRALSMPVAAALYLGFVVPGKFGQRMRLGFLKRLPLQTYRGKPVRSLWLDTFDRLSAPIEHRYTWSELQLWFERAWVTVLASREDAGWFVTLRKASQPTTYRASSSM